MRRSSWRLHLEACTLLGLNGAVLLLTLPDPHAILPFSALVLVVCFKPRNVCLEFWLMHHQLDVAEPTWQTLIIEHRPQIARLDRFSCAIRVEVVKVRVGNLKLLWLLILVIAVLPCSCGS